MDMGKAEILDNRLTGLAAESLFKSFMGRPLLEQVGIATEILRGLVLQSRLDTRGWILAGDGVLINKQCGEIHLDRLCVLRDNVRIAVRGIDAEHKAVLSIGYNTRISQRTNINVGTLVRIGQGVSIGWDCEIMDNSYHTVVDMDGEFKPTALPIIIEDDVWICSRSIILKGVTIGHNSVVAAGSVVVKDVPPNSFVAGNPARVVKRIQGWSRKPLFP